MITFACPQCGKSLSFKDEMSGKTGKCPHCKQAAQVPGQAKFGAAPRAATVAPAQNAVDYQATLAPLWGYKPTGIDVLGGAGGGGPPKYYDFLAPAQGPDELGRLGPYRVLKMLGAGGMGVVFQAEDPGLKRKVALKVMLPSLAASESSRQRFIREAQTAAAIEHDHIVHIYQVGEDRGVPFIAMQFLKGEALDQRLKREGRLPLAEILRIGRETALGLAAAHAHGLIHRDIKPANIWLETVGHAASVPPTSGTLAGCPTQTRVKILDFGLARCAKDNAHLTQTGAIIGTPAYMAPEQARGEIVDARSDLFSLGCVLYRLCTGVVPFRGSDMVSTLVAVAMDIPKAPRELDLSTPKPLSDLVMKLLAKSPADRSASAAEVAELLGKIESGAAALDATHISPQARAAEGIEAGRQPKDNPAAPPIIVSRESNRKKERADKAARVPLWLILCGVGAIPVLAIIAAVVVFVIVQSAGAWKDRKSAGPASSSSAYADLERPLGMKFVKVPAGTFWMSQEGKNAKRHETIKDDFYLAQYTVTQEQWQSLMGKNPSHFSREGQGKDMVKDIKDVELKQFPVESISWIEVQEFLKKLNEQEKNSGWKYRLPTEAEWEYACRGAATSKEDCSFDFYINRPTNDLDSTQANFKGDQPMGDGAKGPYLARTCRVGSYQPNKLGLYDMHGNVCQWCDDETDVGRVIRGGSWDEAIGGCRAADRVSAPAGKKFTNCGFRLVRVPIK